FFGIGAYSAGLLSKHGWGEPLTGLLFAAAIAGAVGLAISFIIARFRHFTLIMITLGLGLLAFEAANRAHWLTGGSDGLQGVSMWPVLGLFKFDLYGYTAYTFAAAMAGLVGSKQAPTTESVSLESISFQRSADVLVMLVLGGAGRLY